MPGKPSGFMENIWGKAKVASSSVSSAASSASKSASQASESSEASKVASAALDHDHISEQLLFSTTSLASAAVTKAPTTFAHSHVQSTKVEVSEDPFCNCWLSFRPSGRGFRGLFETVPRRPSSGLLSGDSLASKAWSGWNTMWANTDNAEAGHQGDVQLFWSKWRIPRRFWFGLPDSTFGVWLDLGW